MIMTLEKRFKKDFKNPMEFWTSEDGSLMSVAVAFSPDWPTLLREKIKSLGQKFKKSRVKSRYAYREWAEREYWYFAGDKGKVWRIGDTETPFEVYEYELETPM